MNQFKTFKNSFRELNKKFIYVFLIDGLYWTVMVLLFSLVEKFVNLKNSSFAGGRTVEEVQQALITASPEELSAFLTELKVYILSVAGSVVLYGILAIVLFVLVQALIWHLILKKDFKKKLFFKWLWFVLLNVLILVITLIPFLIVKVLISLLVRNANNTFANIIGQAVTLIYFLVFIFFFFLYCYYFTKNPKIWRSLADTFDLIKEKFRKIAVHYLFVLVLSIVLFLTVFLMLYLIPLLQVYGLYIYGVISLLFLAWLRIYLVKIVD